MTKLIRLAALALALSACKKENFEVILSPESGVCLNAGKGTVQEISPFKGDPVFADEFNDAPSGNYDPSCFTREPTCIGRLDWWAPGTCSSQDFSKLAKLNKCVWSVYDGYDFWGDTGIGGYSVSQTEVSNGTLKFHISVRPGGRPYRCDLEHNDCRVISGGVWSKTYDHTPGKSFTWGRIEARIRIPALTGLWPAVWLWEQNNRSRLTEYDLMETHPTTGSKMKYFATLHTWGTGENKMHHTSGATSSPAFEGGAWHTVGIERNGDSAKFYLDGCYLREIVNGGTDSEWNHDVLQVDTAPTFMLLNLGFNALLGSNIDNMNGATMEVDYVRVYQ